MTAILVTEFKKELLELLDNYPKDIEPSKWHKVQKVKTIEPIILKLKELIHKIEIDVIQKIVANFKTYFYHRILENTNNTILLLLDRLILEKFQKQRKYNKTLNKWEIKYTLHVSEPVLEPVSVPVLEPVSVLVLEPASIYELNINKISSVLGTNLSAIAPEFIPQKFIYKM